MRVSTFATRLLILLTLFLAFAQRAGAQVATFSAIRDAVPSKFFDAATTRPNPANGNQLIIGFNSGIDPKTLTASDFAVSTLAFGNRTASDTLSLVVTAPAGFYVSRIFYVQLGTASQSRTATQAGSAQWNVAGFPASLGAFTGSPTLLGGVDLSGQKLRSVPISVTLSLFAAGTGSVSISAAGVIVELAPLT